LEKQAASPDMHQPAPDYEFDQRVLGKATALQGGRANIALLAIADDWGGKVKLGLVARTLAPESARLANCCRSRAFRRRFCVGE